MKFIDEKLEKIDSGPVGDIFQGLAVNFYSVKEINFSEKEKAFGNFLIKEILKGAILKKGFDGAGEKFSSDFSDKVISYVQINSLNEKLPSKKDFDYLAEVLLDLLSSVSFVKDKFLFARFVLHNSIGFKQFSFFALDSHLEELMINSPDNVFVFHKKHGMCKTNVSIDEKTIGEYIKRIANSLGKDFDPKSPLLDARLPDGSRVNATFNELSPTGATLTIRKFSEIPLTVLDIIENGTISVEAAAFLWMMVDGFGVAPRNILVAGGTASGKTTLLNILSNFVRLSERVVSIEDTIELSLLARDNWIPLEVRSSTASSVSMEELLRNAMRMRPDRIIVGEVRGPEALTLFTAMDTGHQGCLGTIHANNARETILKLQERPLSVPQGMLPLLDLIVITQRRFSKEKGIQRFVTQIVELSRMDQKVLFGLLFDFDDSSKTLKRTELAGGIFEEMAKLNSLSRNDLSKEIKLREKVLLWMIKKGLRDPMEVLEVIESYYYSPDKVLSMISENDHAGDKK